MILFLADKNRRSAALLPASLRGGRPASLTRAKADVRSAVAHTNRRAIDNSATVGAATITKERFPPTPPVSGQATQLAHRGLKSIRSPNAAVRSIGAPGAARSSSA